MYKQFINKCMMLVAGAVVSVVVSGCANYRLGTTLASDLREVYVPTAVNNTSQPLASAELTRALMREIQREGNLRITDEASAKTRLDVEIVDYRQDSIRFTNNNSPEEYRMVLKAKAVFSRTSPDAGGKTEIIQRTFEGDETFTRGMDTITAQQQCLPRAAEKLAEQIIDACVSAW